MKKVLKFVREEFNAVLKASLESEAWPGVVMCYILTVSLSIAWAILRSAGVTPSPELNWVLYVLVGTSAVLLVVGHVIRPEEVREPKGSH